MAGWVALHREAIEHPLLRDDGRFRAWCWLILMAAWRPTPFDLQGRTIMLERGQLCASRNQLAKEWKWAASTVERFLARLEAESMINRATGQGRTVITICNYAKFQDVTRQAGQAADPDRKPDKQRTAPRAKTGQAKRPASDGFHGDFSGGDEATGQAPDNPASANRTGNRTVKEPSNPQFEEEEEARARDFNFTGGAVARVVTSWNDMAATHGLAMVAGITPNQTESALARLRDDGEDAILEAIALVPKTRFLMGGGDKGWRVNFSHLLKPQTVRKILDREYYTRQANGLLNAFANPDQDLDNPFGVGGMGR